MKRSKLNKSNLNNSDVESNIINLIEKKLKDIFKIINISDNLHDAGKKVKLNSIEYLILNSKKIYTNLFRSKEINENDFFDEIRNYFNKIFQLGFYINFVKNQSNNENDIYDYKKAEDAIIAIVTIFLKYSLLTLFGVDMY